MIKLSKSTSLLPVTIVLALLPACTSYDILREASGIARDGSELVIVSDQRTGAVYRYRMQEGDYPVGVGPLLAVIEIRQGQLEMLGGEFALDLEGIDFLEDGRTVVLSERLGALITRDGILATYPVHMSHFAGRGIEGLAIHEDGRIVGLWEGGYFSTEYSPANFAGAGGIDPGPLNPLFCVHSTADSASNAACSSGRGVTVLEVPDTPLSSQAFRATDLVWQADGDSFIVLLSSLNAAGDEFKFKWLQRFSISGQALGDPINLCDSGYLPEELRSGRLGNFEGLGWFEDSESLIMINDTSEGATAVVIGIDPWPATDNRIACDQELNMNRGV